MRRRGSNDGGSDFDIKFDAEGNEIPPTSSFRNGPENFYARMGRFGTIMGKGAGIGLMAFGIPVAAIVGAGLSLLEFGVKAVVLMPAMTLFQSPIQLVEGVCNLANLAGNALKLAVSTLSIPFVAVADAVAPSNKRVSVRDEKSYEELSENDYPYDHEDTTVQDTRMRQTTESMKSSWSSLKINAVSLLGNVLSIVTLGVITPKLEVMGPYKNSNALDLTKTIIGEKKGTKFTNRIGTSAGTGLIGTIEREANEIKSLASGRSEVSEEFVAFLGPKTHF